jgi:hypothetical protein
MKKIVILALICLIFYSCKKDKDADDVSIPGALAKEFYHKQADQVRIFHYNKDKTLRQYEYAFDNAVVERTEFRYVDGRVSGLDLYRKENNTWKLISQTLPLYDNKKRLSEITIVYPAGTIPTSGILTWPAKYTFQYDNELSTKFSSGVVYHMENNVLIANSEYHFEYDNLGNLTTEELSSISNGTKTKLAVTIYEYLQQQNPKYHLEDILDFQSYNSPNIWARKTVSYINPGTLDEYKRVYEFNADGKLSSFIEQPGNGKRYYEYY